MNPKGRKRKPEDDEAAVIRARILQLRRTGMSFREIGSLVERDVSTVHHHYRKALLDLQEHTLELAEMVRVEELDRLDMLFQKWWPLAIGETITGNLDGEAARIVLQVSDRRRRLMGADPPSKVAQTKPDGSPPDQPTAEPDAGLARLLELIDAARARGSDASRGDADGDPSE